MTDIPEARTPSGIDAVRSSFADHHITKALVAHRRSLEDLFSGRRHPVPFYLAGICPYTEDAAVQPEEWLALALRELAERAADAARADVFRPLALNYNPYGVHFVDTIFGADVFWHSEKGGWQARTLPTPVGSLGRPDLAKCPAWSLARRFARAFMDAAVPGVAMGMPTLSSALNIAVNLYGQAILEAMLADPAAAGHDLAVINEVIGELHRWYRDNVPAMLRQCIIPAGRWQPPGHGQLCGCTTQLLSPELYRTFIEPLDDSVLAIHPHGGMIHLCGTHTQHLSTWAAMPALRAVQVNDRAALDLERYASGLRSDQVLYVNPCDGMSIGEILRITGGRRTVICALPG